MELYLGLSVNNADEPPMEPSVEGYSRQKVWLERRDVLTNSNEIYFGSYVCPVVVRSWFLTYTDKVGDYGEVIANIPMSQPTQIPVNMQFRLPAGALGLKGV